MISEQTTEHELKTDPEAFRASLFGTKKWEIRFNDRNFTPGDRVRLRETHFTGAEMADGAPLKYTGHEIRGTIRYLMEGPQYGLAEGWCIFTVDQDMADAIYDIATERLRQVEGEHWSPEHDDQHTDGELAVAGGVYALHAACLTQGHPVAVNWQEGEAPGPWPFEASWFKSKGPRRDLVRAGALIAAEIERLDRASGAASDE
ncbi:MAG: DUF3850 domain-containing protein [Anaerolineae bacterium]|nr:DUF3850 domain-containing protein [Anaerolineae bacterium]